MSMLTRLRSVDGFRLLTRAAGAGAALISGVVLAGWAWDIESARSAIPGTVAMNPGGTALAVLFGGASLWIHALPSRRKLRIVGCACAGIVLVLALLRLGGY